MLFVMRLAHIRALRRHVRRHISISQSLAAIKGKKKALLRFPRSSTTRCASSHTRRRDSCSGFWAEIAAGVFMVMTGLSMLELFPALKRFVPALSRLSTENTGGKPFLRGLTNGLMPCGSFQSTQILALASGSPISGALSILAFSFGTVPFMFALGALVSALDKRFVRRMTAVGTELVVVMGLVMLSQGGSLSRMIASVHLLPRGLLCAFRKGRQSTLFLWRWSSRSFLSCRISWGRSRRKKESPRELWTAFSS